MSSCDGCIISSKGKDEAFAVAKTQARQQAVALSKPVAIVSEDNGYALYDAFFAYQNKMFVKEVVSHVNNINT